MLKISIKKQDLWDEKNEKFIEIDKDITLNLEHSLISISKWEQIWKKPFLSKDPLTQEQTLSYIKCMCLNNIEDDKYYEAITQNDIKKINDYLQDPMTATFFNDNNKKKEKGRIITSELIYYWMISYNIPKECEKWHINRLLTLIKVCNEEIEAQERKSKNKNKPLPKSDLSNRSKINAQRRAMLNSRG